MPVNIDVSKLRDLRQKIFASPEPQGILILERCFIELTHPKPFSLRKRRAPYPRAQQRAKYIAM